MNVAYARKKSEVFEACAGLQPYLFFDGVFNLEVKGYCVWVVRRISEAMDIEGRPSHE